MSPLIIRVFSSLFFQEVPIRDATAAIRLKATQTQKVFCKPIVNALSIGRLLASFIAERVGGCPRDPMVPVTIAVDIAIPTTCPEFLTKLVNDEITP